jgi:hypothetical protein
VKRNKARRTRESIIMDAFLECLHDDHIKTRRETKESGHLVFNPYFWEQGEFVSLDYIDGYGNIIFTETQPGTKTSDTYHTISIAFPYDKYKPYHDRHMKTINELMNEN